MRRSAIRPGADETELIERARKGDRQAFAVLVERYQRRVIGIAMAVVHNQDDAMELAQETFIRAYEHLPKFESRSSFSTWLYRIAANLAIDWRRRQGHHVVLHGEEAEAEIRKVASDTTDSFGAIARGELAESVKTALEGLTPEHRAVILLREVEGLSYDEIADVLNVPRGTVMSRLHYARNRIRAIIKDAKLE